MEINQTSESFCFITLEKGDIVESESLKIEHIYRCKPNGYISIERLRDLVHGHDVTIRVEKGVKGLQNWIQQFIMMQPRTLTRIFRNGSETFLN